MNKGRDIHCYEYVNHPYEKIRDALSNDALAVFGKATQSAASRAHSVVSELRINIAGIEVGTEIAIAVNKVEEQTGTTTSPTTTRLTLEWEAAKSPRLFPFMKAELAIYALTANETQLDFSGSYEPPMGALGGAMDAVLAHRLAEASVHRFLGDVAAYLKAELADA